MPKVKITNSAGLVQSAGSGELDLSGEVEIFGDKERVETLATGTTLTAADSGKVFLLVQAGANRTATLPACIAGLNFRFIVKTAAANKWEIVQSAGTEDFVGSVLSVVGAVAGAESTSGDTAGAADTLVRFVGGTAVAGDEIELVSDGTVWYIRGTCKNAGGIIFA